MAKQTGLGDNYYVGGYDVSGDTSDLSRIGGGPAALVTTGIDKTAFERLGGLRTGGVSWTSWFNDAAKQQHVLAGGGVVTPLGVVGYLVVILSKRRIAGGVAVAERHDTPVGDSFAGAGHAVDIVGFHVPSLGGAVDDEPVAKHRADDVPIDGPDSRGAVDVNPVPRKPGFGEVVDQVAGHGCSV